MINGLGKPPAARSWHPDVDKIAFTGRRRHRQDHPAASGRDARGPHHLRARWQEPQRDLRRRQPRRGGRLGVSTPSTSTAASAAPRGADSSSSRRSTRSSSRLAEKAKARLIGDPLNPGTEQGPQVSQEQLDKILHYVDLGQKQRARLLAGEQERVGDRGILRFSRPSLTT